MTAALPTPPRPKSARSRLPAALSLTLAVLAAVIFVATLQLREQTRRQLAARDAEIFHAVALMHADDPEIELLGIEDPVNQLAVLLKTSSLKSVSRGTNLAVVQWRVLAARLFDAHGRFVGAFPDNVLPGALPEEALPRLRELKAHAAFYQQQPLSALFTTTDGPDQPVARPVLEIDVPLHTSRRTELAAVAQFLIEAQSMANEFAQLDRNLILQALAAFFVSGGLLTVAITWAFRRLRAGNRLLAAQAEDLRRANEELALAAKTGALGTVTAHLLHGLKNPLSGLQNFMSSLPQPAGDLGDYDRAVASTRRMQAMINQVVNILRESQGGSIYEINAQEVLQVISHQVEPLMQESAVELALSQPPTVAWPNRVAQLTILILTNLIQNALQASPRGGVVSVESQISEAQFRWRVLDHGQGFPEGMEAFAPCQSAKEGGSGIGLALSKQLASHLQATLELEPNLPTGCVFSLSLPRSLEVDKSRRAASPQMR